MHMTHANHYMHMTNANHHMHMTHARYPPPALRISCHDKPNKSNTKRPSVATRPSATTHSTRNKHTAHAATGADGSRYPPTRG